MTTHNGELEDRASAVRAALRRIGADRIDPYIHLIRAETCAGGHYIAEESLEYAVLLLEDRPLAHRLDLPREPHPASYAAASVLEDPGRSDREQAGRVIAAVLDGQDRKRSSPTYGDFRWRRHETEVRDLNATAFLAHGLARLEDRHGAEFAEVLRGRLQFALKLAATALERREVPVEYTNIYLLRLGGLMQALAQTDPARAQGLGQHLFDRWVEACSAAGFHEWGCQTYGLLSLVGLEAAWDAAIGELKVRMGRALEYLSRAVEVHLLPDGCAGGAPARAYPRDLTAQSMLSVWAHVKLGTELAPGTLGRCGLLTLTATYYDFRPRGAALPLATARNVTERTGQLTRHHVVSDGLSLSSQDLATPVGAPVPPLLFLVQPGASPPRRAALLPSCNPGLSAVEARSGQSGLTALVWLRPADWSAKAPPDSLTPIFITERVPDGAYILVNGRRWSGRPQEGAGRFELVVRCPDLDLALTAEFAAGTSSPAWAVRRVDDRLELSLGPLNRPPQNQVAGCAVLLHARTASPLSAEDLAGCLTRCVFSFGEEAVTASHPFDGELAARERVQSSDEGLFKNGARVVRPGQFRAMVNGREAMAELWSK